MALPYRTFTAYQRLTLERHVAQINRANREQFDRQLAEQKAKEAGYG